jgi:hypothetical protein
MVYLFFLIVRLLARLLTGCRSDSGAKDLEILVLRHQLMVLRRKAGPPKLRPFERAFLAAACRILSRDRWRSFFVTPQTVLRWHRELVRRSGRTVAPRAQDARRSIARSLAWSHGWRGRTLGGAASVSAVSSEGWAFA